MVRAILRPFNGISTRLAAIFNLIRIANVRWTFWSSVTSYILCTKSIKQRLGVGGRITQRIFSHIGYKQFWHVQFYAWKTNTLEEKTFNVYFLEGCCCKTNLPWWTKFSFMKRVCDLTQNIKRRKLKGYNKVLESTSCNLNLEKGEKMSSHLLR